MKTSIVILTYNNSHLTKQCIDSIRKYTSADSYEMIVVDNNSTDDTVEYLKSQDDLICIFNNENKGFAGGCNQGIMVSTGDNILLLNNDVVVTPNWLDNLTTALYSNGNIGAVGPITNSCSNFQQVHLPVTYNSDFDDFLKNYNISDSSKYEERLRLIGFCLLIKREIVEQIGLLDELYSMGNYEDDDYSFRIRKAGYRLLLCKDTFIFHLGSASFSKLEESRLMNILNENRQKFMNKWSVDPNLLMPIRKDISNLVKEFNKDDLKLLYIGCAGGSNLLDIKNELPKADLYGIEPNENLVVNTSHFADIKIGNEYRIQEFSENFFDYIIIDYLSPNINNINLDFLSVAKNYVNDNGNIFIVLPSALNSQIRPVSKLIKDRVSPKFNTLISLMFYSELQVEVSK